MTGTLTGSPSTRGTTTFIPDDVVAPTLYGDLTYGAGVYGGAGGGSSRPSLTDAPSTRGTLS